MTRNFKSELLEFLRDARKDSEEKYGYINPYLLAGIAQAIADTSSDDCVLSDFIFDWADDYWSW